MYVSVALAAANKAINSPLRGWAAPPVAPRPLWRRYVPSVLER